MFQEEAANQESLFTGHNENARVCTHGELDSRNDAILLSSSIESFCAVANAKLRSQPKERLDV